MEGTRRRIGAIPQGFPEKPGALMTIRLQLAMTAVGSAAVVAILWLAATPTEGQAQSAGQFPAYKAPRMADG